MSRRAPTAGWSRHLPETVAALFGAGWFLFLGGWRALPTSSLDWIWEHEDASQHVLGWLFFRASRWSLPLGRIDGYAWPTGTTVGFTDSNPLLAIPAKLASPLLPLDFQYVGLWLVACFALQGLVGARLAALGSPSPAYRALGGALLALAPPLAQRAGHDTLCAQFALVALVAMHLAPPYAADGARHALRGASALTLVLAAVHPYLALMALLLTAALAVRLAACDGAVPRRAAALAVGKLFLGVAAAWALLGYLTSAPSHAGDFGLFGADLLAFVNPMGASSLLPALPATAGAWEGNAYLGLGGLALVAAAAVLLARAPPDRTRRRALAPLLALALFLAAFSLADVVRAGGREVVSLRGLYRPLSALIAPFRTSGRFLWPLYYALLGGAIAALPRLVRRPRLAAALLGGALALQVVDLAPRAFAARFEPARRRLADPRWALARARYDHLALVPAQVVGGGPACWGREWGKEAWRPLAYEAYALGMTVNSGYVARGSHRRFERACEDLERDVASGRLDGRTVYVVHPSRLASFTDRPGVGCGALDGYAVCALDAQAPFAAALRAGGAPGAAAR
jgi:hypothetical protein